MRCKTWEIQEQTDAAPHYPVDVDIYYGPETPSRLMTAEELIHTTAYTNPQLTFRHEK